MTLPLPPNWTSQRTVEGKEYFYNTITGESKWERPLSEAYSNTPVNSSNTILERNYESSAKRAEFLSYYEDNCMDVEDYSMKFGPGGVESFKSRLVVSVIVAVLVGIWEIIFVQDIFVCLSSVFIGLPLLLAFVIGIIHYAPPDLEKGEMDLVKIFDVLFNSNVKQRKRALFLLQKLAINLTEADKGFVRLGLKEAAFNENNDEIKKSIFNLFNNEYSKQEEWF